MNCEDPYFQIKIDLDRNNQCVTFKTKIEVGVYFRGIHQFRAKLELNFKQKQQVTNKRYLPILEQDFVGLITANSEA